LNLLIRRWFDPDPAQISEFDFAMQHKDLGRLRAKDFTGELLQGHYFISGGLDQPLRKKESQNGLESPQDRRSAGWHGNQHVCVRRPQVSGSDNSDLAQVDLRPNTFPKGDA
jgi:hypothetical protein